MGGWVDARIDGCMHAYMDGWVGEYDRCMNGCMNGLGYVQLFFLLSETL